MPDENGRAYGYVIQEGVSRLHTRVECRDSCEAHRRSAPKVPDRTREEPGPGTGSSEALVIMAVALVAFLLYGAGRAIVVSKQMPEPDALGWFGLGTAAAILLVFQLWPKPKDFDAPASRIFHWSWLSYGAFALGMLGFGLLFSGSDMHISLVWPIAGEFALWLTAYLIEAMRSFEKTGDDTGRFMGLRALILLITWLLWSVAFALSVWTLR